MNASLPPSRDRRPEAIRTDPPSRVRAYAARALVALMLLLPAAAVAQTATAPAADDLPHIDLDDRFGDLRIHPQEDGGYIISVWTDRGVARLTPEEFARSLYIEKQRQNDAGWVFVIFNITTWWGLMWVSIGLLGQVFFTFRMVLQWVASEKQHKSVVPVGFWWGSLIGGAMLLTYFVWRKDVIGILGQSTGVFIYGRNLWLIYVGGAGARAAPTPAPDTGNAHA